MYAFHIKNINILLMYASTPRCILIITLFTNIKYIIIGTYK